MYLKVVHVTSNCYFSLNTGIVSNLKIIDTGNGHLYSGVVGNRSKPNQKTGGEDFSTEANRDLLTLRNYFKSEQQKYVDFKHKIGKFI